MADNAYLIQSWTLAIVLFEIGFGVFIWNRTARPLLLLIAILMWCSLALISGIAPFCVAMLIASFAFFSRDWCREFADVAEVGVESTGVATA